MKIQVINRQRLLRIDVRTVRALMRFVMKSEHALGNLGVTFVDNRAIRIVNRRFLRHDYATDVIAFPLDGPGVPSSERLLGEIVVSAEMAAVQARRREIPGREELYRYCVHGLLHLLGYRDKSPREFRRMWRRQEEILKHFKIV